MTKNSSDKNQAGSPRSGSSSSVRKHAGTAALVAAALLAGLVLGVLLGRRFPAHVPPPAQNATEESLRAEELERRVSQAEEALHRALKSVKADTSALAVISTEQRNVGLRQYTFTTLQLPRTDSRALHDVLVKELAALAPAAKLVRVPPDAWEIVIDGLPTHRLIVPEAPKKEPEEKASAVKGKLAIVFDDMGEDVAIAEELAKLGVPVAFSIWPDSSHREAVLRIAKSSGREILIHMPMQPQGYPKIEPGPHPLLLTLTADEIKSLVNRAVKRVHGAIGLNNHMGSEFTKSALGMRATLSALSEHGLFFLDSRTSAETVAAAESKRMGLRTYQRDVFLDNDLDAGAVVRQLKKAEATAREKGHAVAICHPHKQTLAGLRQWLRSKGADVQVTTLSSLPPL
jgi:polysaccharide deacetylase 2 family uncharacterized protein YibQ